MDSSIKHNIVSILSCILEGVVRHYDTMIASASLTPFAALCQPNILICDYLERILEYTHCSIECFLLSLVYIDRLIQSGHVPVNSFTIHRVIIVSIVLAIKFNDDSFYDSASYALIGGIPVEELNYLEMEFLKEINFSLLVSCEDYQKYHNELCLHAENGLCPCCVHFQIPHIVNGTGRKLIYEASKSMICSPRIVVRDLFEESCAL